MAPTLSILQELRLSVKVLGQAQPKSMMLFLNKRAHKDSEPEYLWD
jgi:hypothetical protein